MKFELKRIEATLDQINALNAQGLPLPDRAMILQAMVSDAAQPTQAQATQPTQAQAKPMSKAMIQPFPLPPSEPEKFLETSAMPFMEAKQRVQPKPLRTGKAVSKPRKASAAAKPAGKKSANSPVHPFPSQQNGVEAPALPRSKPPSFSSHRHAVNPNLAIGLLKEVETVVIGWQLTLEQTVLEIQALYMEGPIVDGWLESHPVGSPQVMQPIGAATLRHAEIDRLMDYVEEICRMPHSAEMTEAARTGYRLCGLDADGQLWSRPCPAQQVPYVSLAIARYQKLRILFAKKQSLENRLNQLIQNLTLLHGQMQDPL